MNPIYVIKLRHQISVIKLVHKTKMCAGHKMFTDKKREKHLHEHQGKKRSSQNATYLQ